jgi:predicted unusual protein kinase regulating ubiquinone biosynthesis (AarF/ABC1/UbiB family)
VDRPSRSPDAPWALAHRAWVLAALILEAAWLYARHALALRIGWRSGLVDAERGNRFARRFVRTATRFRGGLIKLGQLASLRFEVLPEEITQELTKLRDRVEPHDFGSIAGQLDRELGASHESLFRSNSRIAACMSIRMCAAPKRVGRTSSSHAVICIWGTSLPHKWAVI